MLKVLQLLAVIAAVLQCVESSIPDASCNSRAAPIVVGLPGKEGRPGPPGTGGEQGPPGPIGDTGPKGLPGPPGPQGESGVQGPPGVKGDQGQQGPQGSKGDEGLQGLKGAKGDQGVKGTTGTMGAKGEAGPSGATGATGAVGAEGSKGAKGTKGETGSQGSQGVTGAAGAQGTTGAQGSQGAKGDLGPKGSQGQKGLAGENYVGGSVYTRWGRTTCPSISELVYAGTAAGTTHNQKGGGANLLCLPNNPVYSSTNPGIDGNARIGPVEVHPRVALDTADWNDNIPCAVCRAPRPTTMMIPATNICPSGWTREYYGYLMTSDVQDDYRGSFVCLDQFADEIPGSSGQTDVAHDLFHVEAICDIISCPPYDEEKELTCVVCSK